MILFVSLTSRREALHIWKRRLGSSGTYNKLIKIFESAGYRSYADSVRCLLENESVGKLTTAMLLFLLIVSYNVYSVSKSMNLDEEESQSLPPPTYPPLKPPNPSTQLTSIQPSPQEHYLCISTAAAKTLPKGEHIAIKSFVLASHSQ